MADDWSRVEVEATVADYLDMLGKELLGRDFNKSAHRRQLAQLLNNRTDGAIERKHQNISAILIEVGFVYISGYKPLKNYQQLLFEVVAARLAAEQTLNRLVRSQVSEPANIPSVDDILAALVDPPEPDPDRVKYRAPMVREQSPTPKSIDYLAMEAHNRSLGAAGEEFVLRFEVARLVRAGCEPLASKVERVSESRGDGLGFDVLSFEASGKERFIEVKTTAYGASTPFFLTPREIAMSRDVSDQFHLYRAFSFRKHPKLFYKRGAIETSFSLEPSEFRAYVK